MKAYDVLDLRTDAEQDAAVEEAVRGGARTWLVTFRDLCPDPGESPARFSREVPAEDEAEAREAAERWAEDCGGTEVVEIEETYEPEAVAS